MWQRIVVHQTPPLLYCHNWLNSSNPGNWFKGIFSSNICIIFLSYWYKYTQQHDHGGDDERLMKDSLMMEPLRRQWLPLHLLCLSIVWDLSGIWAAPVNIWNIWTIFIIVRTRYFTDNVFNTLPDDLNFWRIRIHLSTPPMYGTSRVAVEKKIMIIPSRPLPHYVLKPNAANYISLPYWNFTEPTVIVISGEFGMGLVEDIKVTFLIPSVIRLLSSSSW